MQVKLGLFRGLKSELNCPVDTDSVHVALLSVITDIKYNVTLLTWAQIPLSNSCLFFFFKPLTSKGAFLVSNALPASPFLTSNNLLAFWI